MQLMAKRGRKHTAPIAWLPVDSRLLVPFLSFGHVRGIARVFLVIEIVLSILIVFGTFFIATVRVLG